MFDQAITRVRAGVKINRAGDPVPDWGHVSRTTIWLVSVQPLSAVERAAIGADMTVATAKVFTAPGVDADVLATDRIEYAGDTYEVVGAPARWPDPTRGGVHHVEITLKLWGTT